MRPTRRALLAILLATVTTTARAAAPTTSATTRPTPPDVAALIRQLDADDWHDRDAAAGRLFAVGEPARQAVADAAARSDSPEVRSRAAGVIARLDQADVNRPTLVTVHGDAGSPLAIFDAIASAGHVQFNYWPPRLQGGRPVPGRGVPVDLVNRPFWEAFDLACAATGCGIDPNLSRHNGSGPTIRADAGRRLLLPGTVVAGPLTIAPREADGRFAAFDRRRAGAGVVDGDGGGVTLGLLVLVDPKLSTLPDAPPTITITEAVDDQKQSLAAKPNAPPAGGPARAAMAMARRQQRAAAMARDGLNNALMHDVSVELAAPAAAAQRVARLRGTVTVRVIDRSDTVAFDRAEQANHEQRTIGPYRVTLKHCDIDEDGVSYTVTVRAADGGEMPPAVPTFRLEDADGRPIDDGNGGGGSMSDGRRVTLERRAQPRGPVRTPARLVCTAVTATRDVTVPFEMRDLPLPDR